MAKASVTKVKKFLVSPTKLRTFYQCPAKYRLEYIERLGRFFHRARPGFSLGHSLHRVLDTFHNAGGAQNVSAQSLAASLDSAWVASGYENPAEETAFRDQAVEMLHAYHAAQEQALASLADDPAAPPPPILLWTEKTLRIDLSPEIALSGRIDRVDEHADGALEIVDYKSGRDTVTVEDVAGSLALSIYQLLVKHAMADRRVFATLVALRTGASASSEMSGPALEELAAACLETAETLRGKDWENVLPVVNEHCPYCDFLPHCTRHWRQEARREGRAAPEILPL